MAIELESLKHALDEYSHRQRPVWDALWSSRSIGRIALSVDPAPERMERLSRCISFDLARPDPLPPGWTDEWESSLRESLIAMLSVAETPGERFPAISAPRFVHHQSQGICDVFGSHVEAQPDGNYYVHPLPADPAFVDDIEPKPIQTSCYWGAVEWIKYARHATNAAFEFRCPVMTGPIDTANYLLGTMTLMDWIFSEPEALHRLLDKVTSVLTSAVSAIRSVAGGTLNPLHFGCTRGGPDFCSEVRSLLSASVYEEFEAPYLRRIGEAIGPYAIHSCGSWERTIPSAVADPNLRAMHGQIRENDLAELCEKASGRITLAINRSVNVHERYMWPDLESYLRHVAEVVPDSQPLEITISETDLPLWERLRHATPISA